MHDFFLASTDDAFYNDLPNKYLIAHGADIGK